MNNTAANNPIMELQLLALPLPAGLCLKSHLTMTPDVLTATTTHTYFFWFNTQNTTTDLYILE